MKKVSVTVLYDDERIKPIRKFMNKKELSLEDELVKVIDSFYKKYVPVQVREYFEMCNENTPPLSAPKKSKASTTKVADENV